jgi:CubicO group peptidase (beta-lactamase class C family)
MMGFSPTPEPDMHANPIHSSRSRLPANTLPSLVDGAIDSALAERRLVGAMVLVARHGEIVHRRAAGWADREAGIAVGDDTVFRLASVSKTIVSTAALALADQGKLPLDAPVRRWLPGFTPRLADGGIPDITVRHLLTHTAGLGYRFLESDGNGPYARAGVSDGMDDADITLDENLRRLAGAPLLYRPGAAWGYSLAIDVLGGVIEQVCGMALDEAVRTLVTDPLGMRDTGFMAADPSRLAVAYVNDPADKGAAPRRLAEGDVVSPFDGAVGIRYSPRRALDAGAFPSGGAGMAGSAEDLLRLLEALRRGGAYGHSWFVDPARELSVVGFTNAMYEGMSGKFVGDLRDAVYQGLQGLADHPPR